MSGRRRYPRGWLQGLQPATSAPASQPIEGTSHAQGSSVHHVQANHLMNYPVLDGDPQQDKIDDAYGPLFGLPMSFVISRDGRICRKHLGLPSATATTTPDEKTIEAIFEKEVTSLL